MRRRQLRHRADQHFLGAAAAGNQADADFDQAHVGFRRRLHAIAVQRNLGAAAERQAGGRRDDRHRAVTQRHGRLLERADHHVDLVPVAFLRLEQHQHQVGAGGEVGRVVADDQRLAALGGFLDAGLQHLDGVAADRIHLRMELDGDDAVAEIDEARTGVLLDDAALFLRRAEDLQIGRGRLDEALAEPGEPALEHAGHERRHAAFHRVRAFRGGEHVLDADRVDQLERPELPAEPPSHRAIDVVDRVRDVAA